MLSEYTFFSKYARHDKKKNRRETWDEAVDRVKGMHITKYPHMKDIIDRSFELVKSKRVLASQRSLQFGGDPILNKNARIYNCWGSYCDRPDFFKEVFWILLCGGGTGFSVQKHHVAKLPDIVMPMVQWEKKYVVEDSIEGWADALGYLMGAYFGHNPHPKFDFSKIRKKGSTLNSSSGKAPGPEPLKRALQNIENVLLGVQTENFVGRLRPIQCYDIVMHASDAVLSGGK